MIKVYKPKLKGGAAHRVEVAGESTEVWAELTAAMESIFLATCQAKSRAFAEDILMTCVKVAMGEIDPAEREAAE